jgi:pyruvate ferredoxin oxidoreductase gamma subunit
VFEVRFHGRGGQGAVTAADLLALAAFKEGRTAQSFPSFGSERTGAPVVAYCRLGDTEIRTREPVVSPDCVIVIDPTLVHQVELFAGLGFDGYLLVNSARPPQDLGVGPLVSTSLPERLLSVPATEVALRHVGRPMANAALLGGFAALTGQVGIIAITDAIGERFGANKALAERNIDAAIEVFELARQLVSADGRTMLDAPPA